MGNENRFPGKTLRATDHRGNEIEIENDRLFSTSRCPFNHLSVSHNENNCDNTCYLHENDPSEERWSGFKLLKPKVSSHFSPSSTSPFSVDDLIMDADVRDASRPNRISVSMQWKQASASTSMHILGCLLYTAISTDIYASMSMLSTASHPWQILECSRSSVYLFVIISGGPLFIIS